MNQPGVSSFARSFMAGQPIDPLTYPSQKLGFNATFLKETNGFHKPLLRPYLHFGNELYWTLMDHKR